MERQVRATGQSMNVGCSTPNRSFPYALARLELKMMCWLAVWISRKHSSTKAAAHHGLRPGEGIDGVHRFHAGAHRVVACECGAGPLLQRRGVPRQARGPQVSDDVVKEGSSRLDRRFGAGELGLGVPILGHGVGRAPAEFPLRDLRELVERPPGHTQRERCHDRTDESEEREPPRNCSDSKARASNSGTKFSMASNAICTAGSAPTS